MNRNGLGLFVAGALMLAGCATGGRNYQADIDSLNARVNAQQGQIAAKDQELAALQNQMNDQRMAREAAEAALQRAEADRLSALNESKKSSAKPYDSDLK